MEHEGDSDTNCNWCTWNNPQRTDKEIRRLKIRGQVSEVGDCSWGQPESFPFSSYYTEVCVCVCVCVGGLLHSLDCSTSPLKCSL